LVRYLSGNRRKITVSIVTASLQHTKNLEFFSERSGHVEHRGT